MRPPPPRRPPAASPCARWRWSPMRRSRSWTAASPPAARATRCCASTATCPCTTPAAAPPSRGWSTATRMPPSAATVPASSSFAASVRDTRAAVAEGTLGRLLDRHLAWMAAAGTTTAEVKSGYGLDRDTELAMLDAAAAGHPIEVAPTFLGAHAVGPEWDDADDYLTFVINRVMPQAAVRAEAADVFLERGAFDRDQAERYLRAAAGHGLALRLHADQFSEAGGVALAVELGARSVDHLEATGPEGVAALAASDVAAVMLPACVIMLD